MTQIARTSLEELFKINENKKYIMSSHNEKSYSTKKVEVIQDIDKFSN